METDVAQPTGPMTAAGSERGAAREAVAPEVTIDEVDQLLDEVEAALNRLDEGTYGTCEGCGRTIDDGRLAHRPTAQWCAACADTAGVAAPTAPPSTGPVPDVVEADGEPIGGRDDEGDTQTVPDPAPSPWSIRAFPEG